MHARHNRVSQDVGLTALAAICDGFFDVAAVRANAISLRADELPVKARALLVHQDHMTTILQRHCGEPVRLEVLEARQAGESYSRRIVLRPASRDLIVEVGIVRIDLSTVADDVRREIVEGRKPLGEVLIEHNVLRSIDPQHYFRFTHGSPILSCFGSPPVDEAYGRVGVIHCNGREGVQLLEVVR